MITVTIFEKVETPERQWCCHIHLVLLMNTGDGIHRRQNGLIRTPKFIPISLEEAVEFFVHRLTYCGSKEVHIYSGFIGLVVKYLSFSHLQVLDTDIY